jgi:diaminohydroxyphosphoribosylaminopyrimidine deaminase/5-amino-6-(5-phosphoribosylamino)uracil reductase
VGAETVRRDNPRLTARDGSNAKQPWRVILTRSGSLSKSARVFTDRFATRTLVYKRKSLAAVLKDLGQKNITSVMIEGGGEILGQALDDRLIDKVQIYLGPIFAGGPVIAFPGRGAAATKNAARLHHVSFERLGQTVRVTGYPKFDGTRRGE